MFLKNENGAKPGVCIFLVHVLDLEEGYSVGCLVAVHTCRIAENSSSVVLVWSCSLLIGRVSVLSVARAVGSALLSG